MDHQLLSEIGDIYEIPTADDGENPFSDLIEQWDIPISFKRSLQWYWILEEINTGPTLSSIEDIVLTEQEEHNLDNGMLNVGYGPNGDQLMVKIPELSVWFWSPGDAKDSDKILAHECVPFYDHLLILLIHVRNKDYIPWDSQAAKEYHSLMNGK